MPTRSPGEAAKIRKKMKLEKLLLPILSVFVVAVFIILCSLLGKTEKGSEPSATIEPSPAPYADLIHGLAAKLGGEFTDGDKLSTLSFKSSKDGEYAAVTSYMKSGIVCMSITRPLHTDDAEPEPTEEDIFGDNDPDTTTAPSDTAMSANANIAEELFSCISMLPSHSESNDLTDSITKALDSFTNGSAKKANILYGIYMIKLSYSQDDELLSVVCEPA